MLTILPGTTMTLRGVLPSSHLAALASASAIRSTSSRGASAGASIV
ncbi:MAG: hypothetical protein K2K26_06405 [Muribaculaceae bacterium]|nr:hypothetical protein [Muribaculaceae bacterium]